MDKIFALLLILRLPALAKSVCENDDQYTFTSVWSGDKERRKSLTCRQLRNKKARRVANCRVDEVRLKCPQSCGICCEDDPTYTFKLKDNETFQGCAWLTENKKQKKKRFNKYCTKNNRQGTLHSSGGTTVRDACPVSCNFCKAAITSHPISKPANILLIFADDVGTGDLPIYWNSSLVDMPNIDRLASKGVLFRDAHSTPLCTPSRYVLLSGNYAH